MQRAVRARRTGGEAVAGSASALLGGGAVLRAADVDVGRARERRRQRRLARLAVVLWVATLAVWWRVLTGGSLNPLAGLDLGPDAMLWLPAVLIVVLIGVVMLLFIEEIDAIGGRRGGLDGGGDGPVSSGTGGVVNELLVQLQSFDTPPLGERLGGRLIDWVNGWLPASSQLAKRPPATTSWSSRPPTGLTPSTRPCCGRAASTAGSTSTCPTRPAAAS